MESFVLSAPGRAVLLSFARSLRDVFFTLLLRTLLYLSLCFSVVNKHIKEIFVRAAAGYSSPASGSSGHFNLDIPRQPLTNHSRTSVKREKSVKASYR